MAKGNKKKQQRSRKQLAKLTKRKFINKICWSCSICSLSVNPKFCFDTLYHSNRVEFINRTWPDLVKLKKYHESTAIPVRNLCPERFNMVFCQACEYGKKDPCKFLPSCMLEWKDQLSSVEENPVYSVRKNGKKRKKRRNKIYVEATPMFFSRDNNKWAKIIEDIAGEGDNKKQNTSAAGSG